MNCCFYEFCLSKFEHIHPFFGQFKFRKMGFKLPWLLDGQNAAVAREKDYNDLFLIFQETQKTVLLLKLNIY